MHYYIISGELSGDLYGSRLMESLKTLDANSKFTCWGGDHMKKSGGDIVVNLESLSFLGFFEIIKNSKTILRNLFFAKKHIKEIKPDALILIDYPGFNLNIAAYAKKNNIPVFWFIAPQLWAWNQGRIRKFRKYIDKLFVALPFELDYFRKRGVETFYFGHPMMDILHSISSKSSSIVKNKTTIALMPGSRKQEVKNLLPTMIKIINYFPEYRFIVICAQSIKKSFYQKITQKNNIELLYDKSHLQHVSAALVASGTATLELTILNIPQIICYRLNAVSYLLAKMFSKVNYIGLVNILANKLIVRELVQNQFNVSNLRMELKNILKKHKQKEIIQDYSNVVKKIGPKGAFMKIASVIYSNLDGIKKNANK